MIIKKSNKKILIIGGGAIGMHLAYVLSITKNNIINVLIKKKYKELFANSLNLEIRNNNLIVEKKKIKANINLKFIYELNKVNLKKFDYIFITLKLFDYDLKLISFLKNNIGNNTKIIPPCTNLPEWWYNSINNFQSNKLSSKRNIISKYFSKESLICMTMWISGYREGNNFVIRHTQRGYPLKEISSSTNVEANYIRNCLLKKTKSPIVKNIYFEQYSKSINSLIFNAVAIFTGFSNQEIKDSKPTIKLIYKLFRENEKILEICNIPNYQSIKSRIDQTLKSSKHTMSMLTDLNCGKKVELKFLWRSFKKLYNHINYHPSFTIDFMNKVIYKVNNYEKRNKRST